MVLSPLAVLDVAGGPEVSAELHPLGGLWNPAGPTESATCRIVDPAEILASLPGKRPSAADNSAGLPPVGDQQSQGSCTAWAIGYYHASYIENRESPIDLTAPENQTSPAFLYNIANGGEDGGSYMDEVADLIIANGACSMYEMPYDTYDHASWPAEDWIWVSGMKRRAASQNWLDLHDPFGMDALKAHLAAGNTATTAIGVYSNFDYIQNFNYTYCASERYGTMRGGHIVTFVGYDDDRVTADGLGAFRMVNSWGTSWGDAGYWWMSYEAAVDDYLCYGWSMHLESLVDYEPTAVVKIGLDHPERGDVTSGGGLYLEVVENGTTVAAKAFLQCPYMESWLGEYYQQLPFSGTMAFDFSDEVGALDPAADHQYVLWAANYGDNEGALKSFEVLDAGRWEGGYSFDAPTALLPWQTTSVEAWVEPGMFVHMPIRVDSDEDLRRQAVAEFWEGDGSYQDPFAVREYDISGDGKGNCIYIGNTTLNYSIAGCRLRDASGYDSSEYYYDSGIYLHNAPLGKVTGNNATGCLAGIWVSSSDCVEVKGNEAFGNIEGVVVSSSESVSILENTFGANEDSGVYMDGSVNASVYHNNFLGNAIQATETGGANKWDNGYPALMPCVDAGLPPVPEKDVVDLRGVDIGQDPTGGGGTVEGWLRMLAGANLTYDVFASDLQSLDVRAQGYGGVPDLDLGIFLDGANGQPLDGACQWEEFITRNHMDFHCYGSSTGTGLYCYCADEDAFEAIRIFHPPDGHYFVKVLGFSVLDPPGRFDLRMSAEQGSQLELFYGDVAPGSVNLTMEEREWLTAYWNGPANNNCVRDMDGSETAPWGFYLPMVPNNDPVVLTIYDDTGTPENKTDDYWDSMENSGFVEGVDYTVDYGTGYVEILTVDGWAEGYIMANYTHISTSWPAEGVDFSMDNAEGVLTFPAPLPESLHRFDVEYTVSWPGGGNYWSDYGGTDFFNGPSQNLTGGDGIGDSPYTNIQGNNQDNYPLMTPWSPTLPDTAPPTHSNETPVGESTNLTPVVSVRVTDASGIEPSSVRLYVDGFPIFIELTPVPDGYLVSYWHEMGFAPATNHSCRIVADDTLGNRLDFTWYFTTPPPYYVPVVLGWNMISIPLDLFDASLPGAFLDSDTTWDRMMAYDASDPADPWKQYNTAWSPSLNDLASLDSSMGFWLHVTAVGDGNLTVCGSDPGTTTIQLRAGWNLVGYPTQTPRTVAEAFWGTTADIVEVFDPAQPYMTKEVGAGYLMAPNKGYWVHVLADSVWVVDW